MEVFFMSDFKEINITELTASPYNLLIKIGPCLQQEIQKNLIQ